MESNQNIVEKIRKLLRKADPERNNNLNEVLACAEIAQRLMETHRISYEAVMSEVEGASYTSCNREQIIDYIAFHKRCFTDFKNPAEWVQVLLNTVASHNNCELYVTKCATEHENGRLETFEAFSIIGKMTDILVVEEIFYWILGQVIAIGNREGAGRDRQWLNAFRLGVVKKIEDKFKEITASLANSSSSNALSLRNSELQKFVDSMNLKEQKSKEVKDNIAFSSGYHAARGVMIETHKSLDAADPKRLG